MEEGRLVRFFSFSFALFFFYWEADGNLDSSSTYIITLPTPLKLNQSIQLSTTVVLTDSAIPKPAAITQNEEQYLLWRGDAAINSVYHTESGRVKIKWVFSSPWVLLFPNRKADRSLPGRSPTPQILAHSSPPTAYTQDAPFTKSGATITLGPYINVPAYTSTLGGQPFEVHYRFADPVITVKNLKRAVEVRRFLIWLGCQRGRHTDLSQDDMYSG